MCSTENNPPRFWVLRISDGPERRFLSKLFPGMYNWPIIWFFLLFSYCHEQFTVQNSFVQGLYWFILLKLLTVKDSQGTCNHGTKPNFHRTTAECASPALLHQEGNRVWGDLNWLPPALPHPELRNAYSGSRKLKNQNLEDGTRKKKIKWQLDKLQLELSACRNTGSPGNPSHAKRRAINDSVVSVQVLPALFP